MRIPCSSVRSPFRWSLRGTFRVVSAIEPGGVVIDGVDLIVSTHDLSGRDVSGMFPAITSTSNVRVETVTGSYELDLDFVVPEPPESWTFTGTAIVDDGVIEIGQITGLWLRQPSRVPCIA